jgi:hypothetical protein
MKLRDVLTVLGTAAVTAAATLALLAPRGDGNAQAAPAVQPVISQPQLTSQGCTFTLKTDKTGYEAGESPVIEVTGTNPTDKSVTASVWVGVTVTSPVSRMSRMMPIPTTVWTHEYAFTVPPGESKSISAKCAAQLMPLQNVGILMTDKNAAILGVVVGVPGQVQNSVAAQVQNAIQQNATPNGGVPDVKNNNQQNNTRPPGAPKP